MGKVSSLGHFTLVDNHNEGYALVILIWVIFDSDISSVGAHPLIIEIVELSAEEFLSLIIGLLFSLDLLCVKILAVNSWQKSARVIIVGATSLVVHIELDAEILSRVVREKGEVWDVGSYCLLRGVQVEEVVVQVGPVERGRCVCELWI